MNTVTAPIISASFRSPTAQAIAAATSSSRLRNPLNCEIRTPTGTGAASPAGGWARSFRAVAPALRHRAQPGGSRGARAPRPPRGSKQGRDRSYEVVALAWAISIRFTCLKQASGQIDLEGQGETDTWARSFCASRAREGELEAWSATFERRAPPSPPATSQIPRWRARVGLFWLRLLLRRPSPGDERCEVPRPHPDRIDDPHVG